MGFLPVLQFPLPFLLPSKAPHSSIILSSTLHSIVTESFEITKSERKEEEENT
jgi:hypothetical protein